MAYLSETPTKQKTTTQIMTTTTLTGTYQISSSATISGNANALVMLDLVKDDCTSIELLIDTSEDGLDWYTEGIFSTSNLTKNELTLTAANYDDPDTVSFMVGVPCSHLLRVQAKKTGGVGTTTLAIKIGHGYSI